MNGTQQTDGGQHRIHREEEKRQEGHQRKGVMGTVPRAEQRNVSPWSQECSRGRAGLRVTGTTRKKRRLQAEMSTGKTFVLKKTGTIRKDCLKKKKGQQECNSEARKPDVRCRPRDSKQQNQRSSRWWPAFQRNAQTSTLNPTYLSQRANAATDCE